MRKTKTIIPGLLLALTTMSPASAIPILGGELFYTGGDVTVESLPVSSGYVSELGLYDSTFSRLLFLLVDEPPGVSVTFDPGTDFGFAVGDELIFGIRITSGDAVTPTGTEFFMGAAARNPDGVMHANVDDVGGGMFIVSFEDILGGGDLDYDDNRFLFSGGIRAMNEPATLALLGFGLVAAAIARRRRR